MAKVLVVDLDGLSRSSSTMTTRIEDLQAALALADPRACIVVADAPPLESIAERARQAGATLVVLVAGEGAVSSRVLPALDLISSGEPSRPVLVALPVAMPTDVTDVLARGARDVLPLPLQVAEAAGRLRSVLGTGAARPALGSPVPGFIGQNDMLLSELAKIPVVAESDVSVLITGETGTGKELCAQAIHALGPRRLRAFVPVNCGAIPSDLVENELFGHERGAFTGASSGRSGLVHEADGGTLFLDEVNSLPLAAQVKLLRLLQDGTFRALGSTRLQRADLRIVAATNDDLKTAVEAGRFRQDLYYRLNVIPVHLPALRERRDDVPRLAQFFVERHARRMGRPARDIAPDGMAKLLSYSWPGNVRELEHVIERAVVLSPVSVLRACHLAVGDDLSAEHGSFQRAKARAVTEFERGYLRTMLSQHQGNISHAAAAACKDRRAFWELLRKHAIDPRPYRAPARASDQRRVAC